jgi:hypothetical protein
MKTLQEELGLLSSALFRCSEIVECFYKQYTESLCCNILKIIRFVMHRLIVTGYPILFLFDPK